MKLKSAFINHALGEEYVLVPINSRQQFHGVVFSNSTAGFIVTCLEKGATRDELIQAMLNKYNATEEQVIKDVDMVLEKLNGIGALED